MLQRIAFPAVLAFLGGVEMDEAMMLQTSRAVEVVMVVEAKLSCVISKIEGPGAVGRGDTRVVVVFLPKRRTTRGDE